MMEPKDLMITLDVEKRIKVNQRIIQNWLNLFVGYHNKQLNPG
jgi:hypothetical protein